MSDPRPGALHRANASSAPPALSIVGLTKAFGDKLLFDVQGSGREAMSFFARSETLFASAPIFTLQFQLDGQGKVTGLVLEQGGQRIPLQRK